MGNRKIIRINAADSVAVALEKLHPEDIISLDNKNITIREDIPAGHKIAIREISSGEDIVKYGYPIGHALNDIRTGEHVHTHNLSTNLKGIIEYEYRPDRYSSKTPEACSSADGEELCFDGYRRADGRVGIRNEVWIIPTVGCVNRAAEIMAEHAQTKYGSRVDGIFAFTHPMGCSQLADDHETTQHLLAGLARHPNCGAVLLLSLGCENNNLKSFLPQVIEGMPDHIDRVRTMVLQEVDDELDEGMKLLDELTSYAQEFKRSKVSAKELVIGCKCGGSDGLSGITANPLCGRISDRITALGGTVILTEVPEMFGAEQILMDRAANKEVFDCIVGMINGFKSYFMRYGQEVYENPSPGNKEGGITTLEDKSLGCVQKGGQAIVTDVLQMGRQSRKNGLNLLWGPGNDMVSCTALAASGAQLILFTTGRGNPFGGPVPTIKISTNTALAEKKDNWIDFDAGAVLNIGFETAEKELLRKILSVASGSVLTRNEASGYRQIALFKDGVTL